jgi:hypothetical protein
VRIPYYRVQQFLKNYNIKAGTFTKLTDDEMKKMIKDCMDFLFNNQSEITNFNLKLPDNLKDWKEKGYFVEARTRKNCQNSSKITIRSSKLIRRIIGQHLH